MTPTPRITWWAWMVPWIGIWMLELPYGLWAWGFALSKAGPLGLLAPLAVYLAMGKVVEVVGQGVAALISWWRWQREQPALDKQAFQFWWAVVIGWGIFLGGLWIYSGPMGQPRTVLAPAILASVGGLLLGLVLGRALLTLIPRLGFAKIALALLLVPFLGSTLRISNRLPIGGPDKSRPNVLLVTIDTCNLSRLSAYGYPLETTPNLARLAREGVRMDQAYTHIGLTGPSHSSIFTGLQPQALGLYENFIPLKSKYTTLAEQFAEDGYFTAGVPANVVTAARWGMDQGYDRYPQRASENGWKSLPWERIAAFRWMRHLGGSAREMTKFDHDAKHQTTRALEAVKYAGNRNWFMWVHYIDPHAPYEAAEEDLLQPISNPPRELQAMGTIDGLFHLSYLGLSKLYGHCFLKEYKVQPAVATASEIEDLKRIYDAQLVHTDRWIGHLLGALKESGELENTIVVITADHGEALFDRGYFGHSFLLHQDEMHIPMIIWWPEQLKPATIDTPVVLSDLAPTLCDLSGVAPIDDWSGRYAPWAGHNFAPWLRGEPAVRETPVYLERFDHSRGIVTTDHQKLIYQARIGDSPYAIRPWTGAQWLWYDLEADPGEVANRATAHPQTLPDSLWTQFTRLQGVMHDTALQIDGASVQNINYTAILEQGARPSERAALRSIGYLGGTSKTSLLGDLDCFGGLVYTWGAEQALAHGTLLPDLLMPGQELPPTVALPIGDDLPVE